MIQFLSIGHGFRKFVVSIFKPSEKDYSFEKEEQVLKSLTRKTYELVVYCGNYRTV